MYQSRVLHDCNFDTVINTEMFFCKYELFCVYSSCFRSSTRDDAVSRRSATRYAAVSADTATWRSVSAAAWISRSVYCISFKYCSNLSALNRR